MLQTAQVVLVAWKPFVLVGDRNIVVLENKVSVVLASVDGWGVEN